MFNENKYALVFHAGLSLVLYFTEKPDFVMISWNNFEMIFDKIWCKKRKTDFVTIERFTGLQKCWSDYFCYLISTDEYWSRISLPDK